MCNEACFVYWIFDDSCNDPIDSGYVGVSHNPQGRFRVHLRKHRVPTPSRLKVIFKGTRRSCFELEFKLRPVKGIGWNKAIGGAQGWRIGFTHTVETRDKLRKAWGSDRRKVASAFKASQNKKLAGQKRPAQSEAMKGDKNPMFGIIRPEHVRKAISEAHQGRPPVNRQEMYCVGCHKKVNKTTLDKYHKKYFDKQYACRSKFSELYPPPPYCQNTEA